MIPMRSGSLCTVCSKLLRHNFANFSRLRLHCSFLKCQANSTDSPLVYGDMSFSRCVRMKSGIIWEGLFQTSGKKMFSGALISNVQELKKKNELKLRDCRFSKCLSLSIAAFVVITKWLAKTKHTPLPQTKAINNGWINTSLTNHSEYKS